MRAARADRVGSQTSVNIDDDELGDEEYDNYDEGGMYLPVAPSLLCALSYIAVPPKSAWQVASEIKECAIHCFILVENTSS